ncbi:DVUA0089 family protein [Aquincola tertiaricarbonis]|uniref:DVUA0089 family protein n=1 Tax=Aquincola tertiaricarbonis TaxID=391953 RepID=UPI0006973163|nr:DVUA0089 family protein [Aquincola tertiaricarbonis]
MTTALPFALRAAVGVLLAAAGLTAHAADFTLSGNITNHNDVVRITFDVAAGGSDVTLFTDSWQGGLNFDPAVVLWSKTGNDWTRVTENDDADPAIGNSGYFDAGLALPQPAAGRYMLTLVASSNDANGELLSQGFTYDAEAPIAIGQWNQPTYDPNANDQKGSFWRVQFSGVQNVSAVPEPSTWLLMALGAAALVPAARRRR